MDNERNKNNGGGGGSYRCLKCGYYNSTESSTKKSLTKKSIPPNVPKGLDDFLLNFTINIIEKQPVDLDQFAYEYFNDIRTRRTNGSNGAAASSSKLEAFFQDTNYKS